MKTEKSTFGESFSKMESAVMELWILFDDKAMDKIEFVKVYSWFSLKCEIRNYDCGKEGEM
jgi:hypothetical protein